MSEMLPLFPLSTVLFPGMVLPLHIFEQRYRQLVRDLLAQPEPRQFGVIAIRQGREVGSGSVQTLHDIGCVATLREAQARADGRYDVVTVGAHRFRLLRVDRTLEYLRGETEALADEPGGSGDPDGHVVVAAAVWRAQGAFRTYLNTLADLAGATVRVPDIPDDPVLLSYVIAAAIIVDLPERQALLAQPDGVSRLRAERALLSREAAMLRATTSRPAPDFSYEPFSPN